MVKGVERFELPRLAREPREHAALDVGQIGDDQLPPGRGDDAPADRVARQLHDVVGHQVGDPGLDRGDAVLDFFGPDGWPRKVLRLEGPSRPSPGAAGAVELQRAAHAAVDVHSAHEGKVLARARGARLQSDREQLLQPVGQIGILEPSFDRAPAKIGEGDAKLRQDVFEHRVALRGSIERAVSVRPGRPRKASLLLVDGADRRIGKVQVHGEPPIVDLLIEVPERQLCPLVVPRRHALFDLPHRVDIRSGIGKEPLPFLGMRIACRAADLGVGRPRHAEESDEILSGLVLCFVEGYAQDLAKLVQPAGETVRKGMGHGTLPPLQRRGHLREMLGDHATVEDRIVCLDHVRFHERRTQGAFEAHRLRRREIPHRHRTVVDRPRDDHQLAVFDVAIRSPLDRGVAVGLGVNVESHSKSPREPHQCVPAVALRKPGLTRTQGTGARSEGPLAP